MSPVTNLRPMSFRTVFISDVHLGSRGRQAETLLDFLRPVRCVRERQAALLESAA